jgi:pilus assembly protein Flp/PilA
MPGLVERSISPVGHGTVVENERAVPILRRKTHIAAARKEAPVERAKMFPIRLYLALQGLRENEEGQTLVEYALILALVSVTAVAALNALSGGINGIFSKIVTDLGG